MKTFPFGSILAKVDQKDKSPKKVFILGVYASAVHAKWINSKGKEIVKAMAVASEPYIFWKGDGADKIINNIPIPKELGHLEPADPMFNGLSGLELDKSYLQPLGLTRDDVWLCDMIPCTRINRNQKTAIKKHYKPNIKEYNLPRCTIPEYRKQDLDSAQRRNKIIKELEKSRATVIILLGDLPIEYFLSYYSDDKRLHLANYGLLIDHYGKLNPATINGKQYQVIPLVHPKQAGRLGLHDNDWAKVHEEWIERKAPALSTYIKAGGGNFTSGNF
jgi:uracil-DNA glycosylase